MTPSDDLRPDPASGMPTYRAPAGLLDRAAARAAAAPTRSGASPLTLAAVAVLGVAAGLFAGRLGDAPTGAVPTTLASAASEAADAPGAGAVDTLRPVTLSVRIAGAARVGVAGSWNDWQADATPMRAMGDGLFRVVVPLPPGEYEYQFVVDGGEWVPDLAAARHRDDGFGSRNAVLEVAL